MERDSLECTIKMAVDKVPEVDPKYFKGIGLWQFVVERKGNWWVWLNFAIGFLFFINIGFQVAVTLRGSYDFNVFTEKLAVNLTVLESCIKIIYYCFKRSKLSSLTSAFKWDLLRCSSHDLASSRRLMTSGLFLVNRVTKSFVVMIFSTVGVWNSLPVLRCLLADDCSRWNIMPSWYPEHWEFSSLIYIWEFFIMVYCAALLYNANCFFSALALSLAAQYQLLAAALAGIEGNASEGPLSEYNTSGRTKRKLLMDRLLRDCLTDHQTVLRLSEELEDVYNPLFLYQMLASTFTICLVLIQINVAVTASAELSAVTTSKFLMYLVFGLMELLLYSLGGQILSDQAELLHRSLYETGWTEGSMDFRKNISIAMTRTIRPVRLSAGKFYVVNLQSFTQVMKASYSYFTFLHGSHSGGR